MPSFRHTRAMSNKAATWMAPRSGDHPSEIQHGPEVERVLPARRSEIMKRSRELGRLESLGLLQGRSLSNEASPILQTRYTFSTARRRSECGSVRGSPVLR